MIVLEVRLLGVNKPPVWRVIAVPRDYTLAELHLAIQEAMGWKNIHMYSFQPGWVWRVHHTKKNRRPSRALADDEQLHADSYDEADPSLRIGLRHDLRLGDVLERHAFPHGVCAVPQLVYTYDMCIDWDHTITVLDADGDVNNGAGTTTDDTQQQQRRHVCLRGKGDCPPDDDYERELSDLEEGEEEGRGEEEQREQGEGYDATAGGRDEGEDDASDIIASICMMNIRGMFDWADSRRRSCLSRRQEILRQQQQRQ